MAIHVLLHDEKLFYTHFKVGFLSLGIDKVKVVRIVLAQ